MPGTRTLLTLVLVPLLVFLVACGGSDDDDGGSSQPSASDSGGGGSGGDGDSASSSSSNDGGDDSDDDDASAEQVLANCPELMGMFGAFTAGAFTPGGTGSAGDDLEAAAEVFQNAAANAPSEIRADMQVLANAFAGFYAALEDAGVDFSNPASFATLSPDAQLRLQTALESLDSPELQQASDNLDAWFTENCE
jgi:hypothetical protein